MTLYADLTNAEKQYKEKRDYFHRLSVLYADHVAKWTAMSREFSQNGKEICSVYRHQQSKGVLCN